MISGRRLSRNVLWNLIGTGTPLVVAIFAIPLLIDGLGIDRFGVLTLAWMVVGYFSLFDLGLGRALTKLVAERLGRGCDEEIPPLIWTAMILMGFLGVFGAIVVASVAPVLVGTVLNIPYELQSEALGVFYLLACSIPIVISSIGFRGVLEAHQEFGLVNLVRVPLGITTFLGPVAALLVSDSLEAIVGVLVITRTIGLVAYAFFSQRRQPALLQAVGFRRVLVKPLLSFGGWMTVSNIVGPLMVYLDRFLIGGMLTMTAVAYYATPYDVVTKLWVFPTALMSVMFPAFASVLVDDPKRAANLFSKTFGYIFLALFPIVLFLIFFAEEGLTLWIDGDFAAQSYLVMQLLAVGVFINCHAQVPFGLLQSAGRPDLTAKLHLVELPIYLVLLWFLLDQHGIVGAAIAWLVRVSVDTFVLLVLSNRIIKEVSPFTKRSILISTLVLVAFLLLISVPEITKQSWYLVSVLVFFLWIAWSFVLDDDERRGVQIRLRS